MTKTSDMILALWSDAVSLAFLAMAGLGIAGHLAPIMWIGDHPGTTLMILVPAILRLAQRVPR